jgi:hypothetical protein
MATEENFKKFNNTSMFGIRIVISITNNVPLILRVWEIFLGGGKTYNGAFRGIFREGRDLFDL